LRLGGLASSISASWKLIGKEIGAESVADTNIFIDYRDGLLAHRAETMAAEFLRQDGLINRFQQARAKHHMHAESGLMQTGFAASRAPCAWRAGLAA
jgi:hypothetical protein